MADLHVLPAGIEGSSLPGPFSVGHYAARLRGYLRERSRVQLFGEVWNLRLSRVKVYFELRDVGGALPCSMWRNDFDALRLGDGALADGSQVVVGGGLDYYVGSRTSSPAFSFAVTRLRVAGEGDLLAQLDRLRKTLDAEGLFELQKLLERPALPRTIGVVTGEGGKARDDVLAGLARRGWAGRIVWAFAPVQDRHAAPAITAALQDLAATGQVDVIIVARGGGSLADLFCFCDETLCRTVALLGVPVIASVGHHTDRTLIDDVAALSCSTPTHAAESAVPVHCSEARAEILRLARRLRVHGERVPLARPLLVACARRLGVHGRRALLHRAQVLARLSRAPGEHVARERRRLHQGLREMRASGRRRVSDERARIARRALVLDRKAQAAALAARRASALQALAMALAAHDPARTLERGYALVTDRAGAVVTSAAAARAAGDVALRFGDAAVDATITGDDDRA
ncbi:MAG TPA: exodeoxyribonuclease VII large subunit [Solirubrobacteraceae bacterium]|jgi:exodeoxyribonuclease VII large subunit|nr:exodeoxyribonuclease VII large subunit [Solirubrobacteraceae bacterium]